MKYLTPGEARQFVVATLSRCQVNTFNAESVAEALVGAELIGQTGHGLRRLPSYAAQALSGKIDGRARPSSERLRAASLGIDAASGFAYPALDLAVQELPAMARANGIAMAAVRRSHHAGALGLLVERLAEKNLLALAFANGPAAIAPWGGSEPLFGTNPVGFAAPLPEADPIVVDLSLSKVARGKVLEAKQRGQTLPEGWAFAADGSPTTDPDAALAGSMAPMGDAKGTALALVVEILAGALVDTLFGWESSSFFTAEGSPPHAGQLVLAIDAAAGSAHDPQRLATLAARIDQVEGARLPGRRRQLLRTEIEKSGIPLDAELEASIKAIQA